MHLTMKLLFKRVSIFVGILMLGGMLIFCNTEKASLYHGLVTLDLIPQAENFTELYFNKNTTLPDTATENQQIHFTFVIHNLEATDTQYIYAVLVAAQGQRHVLDQGHVMVKINHYYVKNEQIQLLKSSGKQDVIVELTNKRQSIDFWTGN